MRGLEIEKESNKFQSSTDPSASVHLLLAKALQIGMGTVLRWLISLDVPFYDENITKAPAGLHFQGYH